HSSWVRGSWRFRNRPWFWFGGGGWWGFPDTSFTFVNPFFVNTTNFLPAPIDYSQPLPIPVTTQDAAYEDVADDPNASEAARMLDEGRNAFRNGDFQTALAKADAAIRLLPSDTTLHEFRALALFAMGRYSEAAATIYAVLAVGPGWSWETV